MFEKSFLITFYSEIDFDKSLLEQFLKSFSEWAMIMENTWIIKTTLNPKDIHDKVLSFLPAYSRIMVIKVQKNAAWSNIICPSDWINDNLSVL